MLATVEWLRHRTHSPPARGAYNPGNQTQKTDKKPFSAEQVVQTLKGHVNFITGKADGSMKEGLGSPRRLPGEVRF